MQSKNVKKKNQKDSDDFESQILALFDTSPLHQFALQNSIISFGFIILYPSLENSTTGIAIGKMEGNFQTEFQFFGALCSMRFLPVEEPSLRFSFKRKNSGSVPVAFELAGDYWLPIVLFLGKW